jgi:hypothetical protein
LACSKCLTVSSNGTTTLADRDSLLEIIPVSFSREGRLEQSARGALPSYIVHVKFFLLLCALIVTFLLRLGLFPGT